LHQGGTIERCLDRVHFDCGNDDYFDAAPEPGEYLASHWNLGSPLNRFISFSPAPPPSSSSPPPAPPASPDQPGSEHPADQRAPARSQIFSLRNHQRRSLTTADVGGWRYLRVRVPRHRRELEVSLRAAPAEDFDLYVRRGKRPTQTLHQCRSAGPGARERCLVRHPHRGRWYIGVRMSSGEPGAPFQVRAAHRRERH
jgi:hypothetical protein